MQTCGTVSDKHHSTVDPCSTLYIIMTLLRVGSDLQRDSLSSSATFPATHTHVAKRGVPCIEPRFPLHTRCKLPLSAKVCNRWLSVCHISQGVSREASCNPAILLLPTVNLGQERLLPHTAQTARQGARCLTRDVERKAGGWPISKFRSSHDRGNSSTIPAVREDVEPYGPAEAPRQDVGHAHCLACLDFGPLSPGEQYSNGDAEERAYCGESRGVLHSWFIVRILGGYSGTCRPLLAPDRRGGERRPVAMSGPRPGMRCAHVPTSHPPPVPVDDVIEGAAGDATPGG